MRSCEHALISTVQQLRRHLLASLMIQVDSFDSFACPCAHALRTFLDRHDGCALPGSHRQLRQAGLLILGGDMDDICSQVGGI